MPKVLIIGLDAAEPRLLERWIADGTLPALRRLLNDALWGAVENPTGFDAGAAWPSFATGLTPGRHGQFDGTKRLDPETYATRQLRRDELKDPFWKTLSDAGKTVAVVDVPYALLEPTLNGMQIVDWLSHSRAGEGHIQSTPADLAETIVAKFGDDPFGRIGACPTDAAVLKSETEVQEFSAKLLQRIDAKTDLSLELLSAGDRDLLLTVFHEAHDVGHMCWHLHDQAHPRHDAALAARVGDPLKRIYVELDGAVSRLLDAAGPDTTVIVYSSHGMGPNYTGTYLLGQMLRALDGVWRPQNKVSQIERLRRAWRWLPRKWRHLLVPPRGAASTLNTLRSNLVRKDLVNRTSFELWVNDNTGGIRINLEGRERHGRITPGEDLEAFCTFLEDELRKVMNAETGEPVVTSVTRTSTLHAGEMIDAAPDLLVQWNRSAPIRQVHSPTIGTMNAPPRGPRSGDHTPMGLFLARGPAIEPGRRTDPCSAADFAPTVLSLLGVKAQNLDGRPIDGF